MKNETLDVAVIGAGHAGLAISYHLNQRDLRHIVFERARIGETWRTQRWDSFMLNSPNRFNLLPGDTYRGTRPDGFDSAKDFVSYLEGYADRFRLPVQEDARVVSVERNSSRYHVTALVRGDLETYICRQVVVASGALNQPKIPGFAKTIAPDIKQCHAGEYRSPSELPDGAVLVVGSAQSGVQIAEDLSESGRSVYLSTSAAGRVPRRYRDQDILEWMLRVGFYDVRTLDVADQKELEMKQPQVSGIGPLGHTLSLQSLARRGVVIVGKIDSAGGNVIKIQPNAVDHIRFSDAVSSRIKDLVEKFILEHNLDAPPAEPDPADEPDTHGDCASPLRSLDLEKQNICSIIWATGFTGDFSYLKCGVIDGAGKPVHRDGISNAECVYFLGFPWLRKRKSSIINGITEDAAFIAEAMATAS
jgi:putative flavoprotein involved in K+ transport